MRIFNKLVRDKIPEIIIKDNKKPIIKKLNNSDYIIELNRKIQEEVKEYLESNNIEELADIIEVIYGILDAKNISFQEFEKIRKNKVKKRGAFKEKIFLERVLEDGE
jgi:predicted house-cleaning noncanonical NTP pyrophosphatase (MazG superfamily)